MLFQTFPFFAFFMMTIVFLCFLRGKLQKVFLLIMSLIFYAWGSFPQLGIFVAIIILTYFMGLVLERRKSKIILFLFVVILFSPLLLFKYFAFFLENLGIAIPAFINGLSLPIGISFYTFQAAAYIIDVWKNKIESEKNLITYALFISFFPQLIAGPIERASDILNQLSKKIVFNYDNFSKGFTQMGVGLFLKLFIADRLAYIVNPIYNQYQEKSGIVLLIGTICFGFQIYCDFYGYSTIAKGCARVLGINLSDNFRQPYFSKSCTEFWRRWHITLSTWFKDYIYFPLGGNRCSIRRNSLNLFITFLISGLWHGANWTFIFWGGLNGVYQIVEKRSLIYKKYILKNNKFIRVFWTFSLITLSWVFFRSDSIRIAFSIIKKIILIPSELIFTFEIVLLDIASLIGIDLIIGCFGLIALFCFSSIQEKSSSYEIIENQPVILRHLIYLILMFLTLCFGFFSGSSQFIYFRF